MVDSQEHRCVDREDGRGEMFNADNKSENDGGVLLRQKRTYTSVETIHSTSINSGLTDSRPPCQIFASNGSQRIYL